MPPSSTPVTISGSRSAYLGSAKRSATWTTSLVLTMRPKADVGRCRGTRRRCSSSGGGVLCAAAIRKTSPSRRYMFPNVASQMRTAFASMVSKTGSNSPGELEMTCSTSEVAVCCSSASDSSRVRVSSFFSRSRACALSFVIKVTRALSDGATRVLAFVPVERSLRPRVRSLRPLARQGHLVGTVTGPLPVGASQGSSPSILTEPHDELRRSFDHLVGAGEQFGGISRPSAFAVLRLMTSSSLFTCSTGNSAGFTPLRIRPA